MNFYFLSKSILPGDDEWANSGMNEQETTGLYQNDFIGGISLSDRAMELPIRVETKSKGRIMPGAFFFPLPPAGRCDSPMLCWRQLQFR